MNSRAVYDHFTFHGKFFLGDSVHQLGANNFALIVFDEILELNVIGKCRPRHSWV